MAHDNPKADWEDQATKNCTKKATITAKIKNIASNKADFFSSDISTVTALRDDPPDCAWSIEAAALSESLLIVEWSDVKASKVNQLLNWPTISSDSVASSTSSPFSYIKSIKFRL